MQYLQFSLPQCNKDIMWLICVFVVRKLKMVLMRKGYTRKKVLLWYVPCNYLYK